MKRQWKVVQMVRKIFSIKRQWKVVQMVRKIFSMKRQWKVVQMVRKIFFYEEAVEGCSNGEKNIFPEFLLLVKDRRFWQQSYLTYVSLEYKYVKFNINDGTFFCFWTTYLLSLP